MKTRYKVLLIAVPAALALTAAITVGVLAAPRNPNTAATSVAQLADADYAAWGCPFFADNLSGLATLLGMTPAEIQAQLQQGKSLVDIAATKGVTEDQLVAKIIEPMKAFMQEQVTAGRWTQAQVDTRLQYAQQHVRQLVEAKGLTYNNGRGYGCGGRGMMGWASGKDADDTPGTTNNGVGLGGMMGRLGAGVRGMMGRY